MGDYFPALKDVFSYKSLVHAIAGATGSSVAITAFYPLDVARTKVQVEDKKKRALHSTELLADIYEKEGLDGLYRGWVPTVTSICCSNFVYFFTFNSLKAVSYPKGVKPYPSKDLVLAYLAGVVNVLSTTPLWVANTRLKIQTKNKGKGEKDKSKYPHYHGTIDCLKRIYKEEGIQGLWSSTVPSLILATNPAVHFMVYEAIKRYLLNHSSKKHLSGFTYFLIGALAKMVATLLTYPLQVVQARERAGRERGHQGLRGMILALRDLFQEDGIKSLYKGLETKLLQTMLMAALMFLTYEKIAALVFRIMRAQMPVKAKPA